MERPRLRDNRGRGPYELYPIGQLPREAIHKMSKWLTYYYLTGNTDLSGSQWGDAFAAGIGGKHLDSPLGLADVVYQTQCWSTKTVKSNSAQYPNKSPFNAQNVRIISGRCSPDYSYGIEELHEDIQKTGAAVIGIYNERINIAKAQYEPLRAVILVRNFTTLQFVLFEHDIVRYVPADYEWRYNKDKNIEAFDNTGRRHFTWQFHGSQLTVRYAVPSSAIKFQIKHPPVLDFDKTLEQVGFDDDWITII